MNVPKPSSVMVTRKGVFAADHVADASKISAPNGRTAKPAAKPSRMKIIGCHPDWSLLISARNWADKIAVSGAVNVKVVPFENGASDDAKMTRRCSPVIDKSRSGSSCHGCHEIPLVFPRNGRSQRSAHAESISRTTLGCSGHRLSLRLTSYARSLRYLCQLIEFTT